MNNRNNASAIAFVALVWTVLLVLAGQRLYKNLTDVNTEGTLGYNFKKLEDLNNGNP